MAFPITISRHGNSNQRVLQGLRSGRIPYVVGFTYHWILPFTVGQWAGEADGSTVINLNTLAATLGKSTFPTDVEILAGTKVYLVTAFAGGTVDACTIILGDTNDDNGLVTSTNVFTGQSAGWKQTPSAAEYAQHYESAFVPAITIATTTGNTNALTAGSLIVDIPFTPAVKVA